MAAWIHKRDTRDPLEQLIERESRTCNGCIHLGAVWLQSWCLKTDVPAKKRCAKSYKEK